MNVCTSLHHHHEKSLATNQHRSVHTHYDNKTHKRLCIFGPKGSIQTNPLLLLLLLLLQNHHTMRIQHVCTEHNAQKRDVNTLYKLYNHSSKQ